MEQSQISRTARGAALHRAAHQLLDRPLVLPDPYALPIVGREAQAGLRSGRDWHVSRHAGGLRAFIVARSRVAEDELAAAARRGPVQYVLLGAGLDTFAWRAGETPCGLRVFEVDHPATQRWKRARLARAGIAIPANLAFAPVQFERQSRADGLARAGFDMRRPAVFAWLGVTPYLSRDAIFGTLRFVAALADSAIVFDYAEPAATLAPSQRASFDAMELRVAALVEPFRSLFEPEPLGRELRALGFSDVDSLDGPALNARYFSDRDDGLKIGSRGHAVCARKNQDTMQ